MSELDEPVAQIEKPVKLNTCGSDDLDEIEARQPSEVEEIALKKEDDRYNDQKYKQYIENNFDYQEEVGQNLY